jgi:hypothetical protein
VLSEPVFVHDDEITGLSDIGTVEDLPLIMDIPNSFIELCESYYRAGLIINKIKESDNMQRHK